MKCWFFSERGKQELTQKKKGKNSQRRVESQQTQPIYSRIGIGFTHQRGGGGGGLRHEGINETSVYL